MRVMAGLPWLVAALGLVLSLYSGYRIVNGPFLGGAASDGTVLMLSLAGFIVGIVVFSLGLTRAAGVGARY